MNTRRSVYLPLVSCLLGCNVQALVVRATVESTEEVARERALTFPDPEAVGPILAESTVVNEGYLHYTPDYEPLLMTTILGNVGYGTLFLQSEAQEAELAGDFARVERLNQRSSLLFARALALAKHLLRLWDDGFDEAIAGGEEKFLEWLDDNFYEPKDAEVLLTAAAAYGAALIQSEEGLAAAVDLPYARAMIERSVQLDPTLNGGLGLMMLGVIECTIPEQMGGRPKVGLKLMQRAMQQEQRHNHSVLVTTAQRCAVALQDRNMFDKLLTEVIEAKDVEKYRLTNKIARRDAFRLIKQADELFYE
jgi:hypothetical protein